jgi:hypothetical protein
MYHHILSYVSRGIFGRPDIMYHKLPYVSVGIFGRLDIMYHRLSYVSEGPSNLLYSIYTGREP